MSIEENVQIVKLKKTPMGEQFAAYWHLDSLRAQGHRVVVSVEVYDPTGKSSVMRRGATFEEAVKQVKEAMETK